jgi:hypothetical protein
MSDAYTQYLQALMAANPPGGQANPTLYAPQRAAMENQFNVAQGQLRDSMPRGGQLNSKLADLILQRAQSVGGLDASLYNQSMNRAMQLGPMANTMNMFNRNQTQQNWAGLGSGLGILAGLALGSQQNGG